MWTMTKQTIRRSHEQMNELITILYTSGPAFFQPPTCSVPPLRLGPTLGAVAPWQQGEGSQGLSTSEPLQLSVVISCSILKVLYLSFLTSHFLSPLLFSRPWPSAELWLFAAVFLGTNVYVSLSYLYPSVHLGSFVELSNIFKLVWAWAFRSCICFLISCLWPLTEPAQMCAYKVVLCTNKMNWLELVIFIFSV